LAAVLPSPDCSAPRPYWQIDWTRPTLLLLGNEGAGLAPDLLALADQRITIPHSSEVESLNVAVAAAPLLLERWRQSLLAAEP
jgi:TrmH family RNA methyltransferase